MIRTYFCPTCSGFLHMGGLYNAYLNWKFAKSISGGQFGIRIDGLLEGDCYLQYTDAIISDLKSFGIEPDFIVRQNDRIEHYKHIFNNILTREDVYFCNCSERDIIERMAEGKFPRPCRAIIRPMKYELKAEEHNWFRYRCKKTAFYDGYCADRNLHLDLEDKGTTVRLKCKYPLDIVLWMEGYPDLAWTSALDNKEFEITHSIDGIDLESFSWLEIQASRIIDYQIPHLFHGLVVDEEGYKLDKSSKANRVIEYGIPPEKIIEALGKIAKLESYKPISELEILRIARGE